MNLVIVESPAKSKTIEKYLGSDFKVVSSKGHIRDLATKGKFGLGVDVDNDFTPTYIPIKGKSKDIAMLKKEIKASDKIYLATDPDREGEAISWHLKDALDIDDDKYERIVFNEITKDAILNSFSKARKIDDLMVRSQETRRILDRIIGFRLSKLMQSKTGGKSAGRVQSVALKLICDREEEIKNFISEEYWTIDALFPDFKASLFKYKDNKIEIKNELEANKIKDALSNTYEIEDIEEKDKKKQSKPPYITSTLQQDAINKLNFSSKKTMQIAQKLYEGVNIGSETVGLITYMRTDSVRLSPVFTNSAFKYIEENFGKEYVGSIKFGKQSANMQDAHEGIRPTDIYKTPDSLKKYLSTDEYKLYKIIYERALASLMADAKYNVTTVSLDNEGYIFKASGSTLVFDGFLKVYNGYEEEEDNILPNFKDYKSNILVANEINKLQHFTKPAARYTESTLIKELESLGIGRPSTYATIIGTIKDRDYVTVVDKKFIPTEMGIITTDKLQEFFSNLVNVEYTANMESDLDKIANNELDYVKLLNNFYNDFEPLVEKAFKNMEKKEAPTTGETCPECGGDLVIRHGKFGEFVACSNYPTCKYIKKEEKKIKEYMKCPKCEGTIVEKKTKRGKVFYGCNNYPKCDFASWYEPVKECPSCHSIMVAKKDTIECIECGEKE